MDLASRVIPIVPGDPLSHYFYLFWAFLAFVFRVAVSTNVEESWIYSIVWSSFPLFHYFLRISDNILLFDLNEWEYAPHTIIIHTVQAILLSVWKFVVFQEFIVELVSHDDWSILIDCFAYYTSLSLVVLMVLCKSLDESVVLFYVLWVLDYFFKFFFYLLSSSH